MSLKIAIFLLQFFLSFFGGEEMEAADLSCKVVNVQDFCSQDINRRIFSAIEFLFWRKGKKRLVCLTILIGL